MTIHALLRRAAVADCADIYQVHDAAVQYTCGVSYDKTVLDTWSSLLVPESYLETLSDPQRELWVIETAGHIRGFFQIDLKEGQLDALYIHPFQHKKGLGTAMLHRAEILARAAGLGFLKTYASLNSIGFYLINDYQSLGRAALPLNKTVTVECELMKKDLF